MVDDPLGWMDDAPCKGHSEIFFARPIGSGAAHRRAEIDAQAKAMCGGCPHREPCREYGRATHAHGTWGGETEEERTLFGRGPEVPDTRGLQLAAEQARAMGNLARKKRGRHGRIDVPDLTPFAGWTDMQIAGHFEVCRRTVVRWKLQLRERRTG